MGSICLDWTLDSHWDLCNRWDFWDPNVHSCKWCDLWTLVPVCRWSSGMTHKLLPRVYPWLLLSTLWKIWVIFWYQVSFCSRNPHDVKYWGDRCGRIDRPPPAGLNRNSSLFYKKYLIIMSVVYLKHKILCFYSIWKYWFLLVLQTILKYNGLWN